MGKHLALALTCALALPALAPAAQAEEWAAQAIINSNGYMGPGPVRWGKTSDEAAEKAVGACQQLYPVCGQNAAIGRVGTDKIFVTTCCNGGANCQVLATPLDEAAGRKAARNLTVKNVKAAGYPAEGCRVVAVHGVKTGKKLKN